jgi:hypothetical protein
MSIAITPAQVVAIVDIGRDYAVEQLLEIVNYT